MPATTIHDILAQFRDEELHNRHLGDRFECLICRYLELDPLFADRFSNVWMWNEWPKKGNSGDMGIDTVAVDALINKINLTGQGNRKMEIIVITDKVQKRSTSSKDSGNANGKGQNTIGTLQTLDNPERPSLSCLRTGVSPLRETCEKTRLVARFRRSEPQRNLRRFAVGRP